MLFPAILELDFRMRLGKVVRIGNCDTAMNETIKVLVEAKIATIAAARSVKCVKRRHRWASRICLKNTMNRTPKVRESAHASQSWNIRNQTNKGAK